MLGRVLQFDDLCAITGYCRGADVERCLDAQGIRYFRGKAGIWTTLDLVNAAGGLKPANGGEDYYSPDLAA